jgi:TPR repeat protein
MKKKFIYAFLGVVTLSLSLTSCKKYLDINKNPNTATAVDPKLLFSYAVTSYVDMRASGDLYIPMALAGQSIATGGNNPTGWGIPSEEEYVISSFSTGNVWRTYYSSVGANLKQAISLAEAQTPKNNNSAAQCKVMLALAFYELTTIYGDVPYTEALNTDISYPHFDPQQTVLNGVISLLDQAIAQFDPASPLKISDYDLFYKGDIAKWTRLAKSLKLRTLMTMVDKDPTKAATIGQMISAGGLVSSAADNFQVSFQDVSGKKNPKYAIGEQYNGGQNFFFASKYVTDVMIPVNDPRLPKFFDKAPSPPAGATGYEGILPGTDGFDGINPRISTTLQSAVEPETIFDYQDELFYEAEIYARGLGVTADASKANGLYKQALAESAKYYGVDAATAATFANGMASITTTGKPAADVINLQHWVDLMDRGIDAFTQWRRSGPEGAEVPALTIPVGAPGDGLFRRYEYPITNEISVNPNAPKTVIKYYTKQWFDL